MDPALAQVLAALITGAAAIVVAWIGSRGRKHRRNGNSNSGE